MDNPLRNRLWNCLDSELDEQACFTSYGRFTAALWDEHLRRTTDTIPQYSAGGIYEPGIKDALKQYFFDCQWHEAYDLLEFVESHRDVDRDSTRFVRACNRVLAEEQAGYRFVGQLITPITDETEMEALDSAVEASGAFPGVRTHLQAALGHLSHRQSPDYRNSIKESISAVEGLVRLVTQDDKATLGDALKTIEHKSTISLHPALGGAFSKLYGYTSDADGIRHALMDEREPTLADAKFMLVACSAFVNYVTAICADSGISLSS